MAEVGCQTAAGRAADRRAESAKSAQRLDKPPFGAGSVSGSKAGSVQGDEVRTHVETGGQMDADMDCSRGCQKDFTKKQGSLGAVFSGDVLNGDLSAHAV